MRQEQGGREDGREGKRQKLPGGEKSGTKS